MKAAYVVPEDAAGKRLDAWLAGEIKDASRSRIQKWIKAGEVLVDGKAVTPHLALEAGQTVEVRASLEDDAGEGLAPRPDLPLEVVHEDADVLVISKPAGMLVHPAVAADKDTLVHAVLARYPEVAKVGDSPERPGIVHRLDRDASGLLVVARTKKAFNSLKKQFQAHTVEKEYAVLVDGKPPQDAGTIRLAIGRSSSGGKMAARPEAGEDDKEAITHYSVEERFPKATLMTVRTETGRTHQIRAHFHALGCPVVGDPLYGTKLTVRLSSPRLFLHAKRLSFDHPKSGKRLEFASPIPKELEDVLAKLRRGA